MQQEVLKSWNENADEWVRTLEEKRIPSREVTNNAITSILSQLSATKILDCGCGEGWLTRKMTEIGKESIGIDATSALIANAKTRGQESFYLMSYDDINSGREIPEGPFEVVVFNFSIYQKDGLIQLFKNIKKTMIKNGSILIQTLHPNFMKQQGLPLKSQWIEDSWKGLSGDFKNGHRWFARTFDDWATIFSKSDLLQKERIEVADSENNPVSVIFILSLT